MKPLCKMYARRSIWKKINYKLTPFYAKSIVFILLIFFIYFIYRYVKNINWFKTKTNTFAAYMQEYVDETFDLESTEKDISFILDSFQYTQEMIPSYNWKVDVEDFGDFTIQMKNLCLASATSKSAYYKNREIWKKIIHFSNVVMEAIPAPPVPKQLPWGSNWYQFSITFPLFLVLANYMHLKLFGKINEQLQKHLGNYIQYYFEVPKTHKDGIISMGWQRDGPNVVMMAVPYIGGHLILKDLNPRDNVCRYAENYVKFKFATSGEGLYPDGGFVFHTGLRAYGYIYSCSEDIVLVSKFFGLSNWTKLKEVYAKLEHPKIDVHNSAWFTRSKNLGRSAKFGNYGEIGFFVIDSIRGIIAKTDKWMLQFNGQKNNLGFYEADKNNFHWGLVWLGARIFYNKNTVPSLHTDLVTRYPGVISYGNKIVDWRSDTNTTTLHYTNNSCRTIICSFPNCIGIRNEYKIAKVDYNISVIEMVLITKRGHHSYYHLSPDTNLHSQNAITLSVNLGKFVKKENNSGLGERYIFDDSISFIYSPAATIINEIIEDPITKKRINSLQIKPMVLNDDEGEPVAKCGYSTVYDNIDANSVYDLISINKIVADNYVLEYDKNFPKTLYLYNKENNQVAISREMDVNNYETTFKMEISTLYEKFKDGFTLNEYSKNINGTVLTKTNDRYQMTLNNVQYK